MNDKKQFQITKGFTSKMKKEMNNKIFFEKQKGKLGFQKQDGIILTISIEFFDTLSWIFRS